LHVLSGVAAVVGLMIYPQVAGFESRIPAGPFSHRMTGTGGRLSRMGQWLRDSF
jgi:cell division protein FtsA